MMNREMREFWPRHLDLTYAGFVGFRWQLSFKDSCQRGLQLSFLESISTLLSTYYTSCHKNKNTDKPSIELIIDMNW